jgi:hypothetical protein
MQIFSWIKSKDNQKLIERWWIAIVLLGDTFKTIAVDKTFEKYGVNPSVYMAIAFAIAVPYAISTSKLFFSIVEKHWRNTFIFGSIVIILHLAPDANILSTVKSVPRSIFDRFILAIIIFALFGIRAIVIKVREHKK